MVRYTIHCESKLYYPPSCYGVVHIYDITDIEEAKRLAEEKCKEEGTQRAVIYRDGGEDFIPWQEPVMCWDGQDWWLYKKEKSLGPQRNA